jgi:mTERF domain-containing protein
VPRKETEKVFDDNDGGDVLNEDEDLDLLEDPDDGTSNVSSYDDPDLAYVEQATDDACASAQVTATPRLSLPFFPSTAAAVAGSSTSSSNFVSYFYLKDEVGLSEEVLWKITFEAGSALGMTAATIRKKVELLRNLVGLSMEEVRTVLGRHPALLHLSAEKNLGPTVLYLVRSLDLGRDDLRSLVVGCPSVLAYSRDRLASKLDFFRNLMGYSLEECRALLVREPRLMRSAVATSLVPKMRFLVRDMEVPLDTLRSIVLSNPRLLLYSLDDNLIPKLVYFLIMTLQMDLDQVQKLLTMYPQFLDYNLDRHILPLARYLMKDLEYNSREVRAMVLRHPRLLTFSLARIKRRAGYLRYELGLSADQVRRVLYQAPQAAIGLSDDHLRSKVEFLRSALGFDLHDEEDDVCADDGFRKVLTGMPTLLSLSVPNNLQPKVNYLQRSLGGEDNGEACSLLALREAVLRLPTLLGYSLEGRIRPRMERIVRSGVDPSSITVGIPMKDTDFDVWLSNRGTKVRRKRRSASSVAAVLEGDSSVAPSSASSGEGFQDAVSDGSVDDGGSNNVAIIHALSKVSLDGIVHWTRERRPRKR